MHFADLVSLTQQFTNKYWQYSHHPTREGQTPEAAAEICETVKDGVY